MIFVIRNAAKIHILSHSTKFMRKKNAYTSFMCPHGHLMDIS